MTAEATVDQAHHEWLCLAHTVLAPERDAEALAADRAAFHASMAGSSPLSIVAANAQLDPLAAEVLAVLCAVEMERGRSALTLGDVAALWDPTERAATCLSPESPLVRSALVRVAAEGRWASRPVSVSATVCWALLGDPSRDVDLDPDVVILEAGGARIQHHRRVLVVGADRQRRLQQAMTAAAGLRFLVGPPPVDEDGWRALVREATLRGAGVALEVDGLLEAPARQWIRTATHLCWIVSSPTELPLTCLPEERWFELVASGGPASAEEWEHAVGDRSGTRHGLGAEQLRQVGLAYPMLGGDVDASVRRLAGGTIDRLARRIRPRRGWPDLVAPERRLALLRDISMRYRHRETVIDAWGHRGRKGRGVVALFHGPSGTGKTLSAEIVACDLGLDLFVIDLAAIVSKYIGETEKNLEQIFEAASSGRVVLLFDEADAIFGERSKTQDAQDRYANLEVSYLLQRIEAYEGIAVLTTNLMSNIDQAFLRRIDVAVEYALPDETERRELWRSGFPPRAPLGTLDLDLLASQFKIAGGAIHNVALTAAFLAADRGEPISMSLVMEAMGREYAKLGRLRTAEEFGDFLHLVR